MYYDELSMTEFSKRVKQKDLVAILPIGAVEAHGPHLPLSTDSLQPEHVAREVAKKLNALILPPFRYGMCSSTKNYPGTISISPESLRMVVRDIISELVRNGVRNIVVLAGHAGLHHISALKLAAQDIVDAKKVKIMVLSDYDIAYDLSGKVVPEDDGHAGTIETSRVMAIRPDLHKARGKKSENRIPHFRVFKNPDKYWANATNGDPTKASALLGKKVNDYIVKALVEHIKLMLRAPE